MLAAADGPPLPPWASEVSVLLLLKRGSDS